MGWCSPWDGMCAGKRRGCTSSLDMRVVCFLNSQQSGRCALQIPAPQETSKQQSRSLRPASPPASPRKQNQQLLLRSPTFISNFRGLLLRAGRTVGGTELQEILLQKFGAEEHDRLSALLEQGMKQHSSLPESHLSEIECGLDKLLRLFTSQEVLRLLQHEPLLLGAPLASWLDFLEVYGFSPSQMKNLVSQTPELLVRGDLVTAGAAIVHLKQLGFDNDEVRHRMVAYCPQILMMAPRDIDTLVRLFDKFQVGVDERVGM